MKFVKAFLQEVSPKPVNPPQTVGKRIEVQINPATLRVQMSSTADAGKDADRQKTQHQAATSTLTFDLMFDTADEGTTANPLDVRTRTRQLERFVLPQRGQVKSAPARVKFQYGAFSVIGVMTALTTDLDFFATSGIPLRAKCSVIIKEQKPEFDANAIGPGANTGAGATPPVPPGAAPGLTGPGAGAPAPAPLPPSDRTGTALAGESAPDFAARMGLDPRAWKGLQGLTDPVRLPAGLRIDFSAALSVDAGIGVETAATGVAPADVLSGSVVSGSAVTAGGTALTAAGGLSAALDRAASATAGAAAQRAREAFAPAVAPAAPAVDARARTFGLGVPLRPRIGVTGALGIAVPVAGSAPAGCGCGCGGA